MRLCEEETFGPIVAVYPVDSVDEAIERANATPYGLNASVWTRDIREGRKVAGRIRAGTVNVNEAYSAAWASVDSPMGGVKASGVGRRHGAEGIRKFTEGQTIAAQRGLPLAPHGRLDGERFSRVMTWVLRLLRRIPLLR
jgi:succinate-semialdehyde dehydrogenase/glutarate-semialdehyde dehydrogenase